MINFIINYCYRLDGITFELDHYSNLFITKNTTGRKTYPCLIAHMDEARTDGEGRYVEIVNDIARGYIDTTKGKKRVALGADDANGIYVALHLLEQLPDLKVCFTVEEEIGAIGAMQASYNTQFFNDCQYLLQADRRGKSDLIFDTNCCIIVSDKFRKDLYPIAKEFNYTFQSGVFTDVGEIAPKVKLCGVNISCGYYNEHTLKEETHISELQNCLNFMYQIINKLEDNIYPLKAKKSNYFSYTKKSSKKDDSIVHDWVFDYDNYEADPYDNYTDEMDLEDPLTYIYDPIDDPFQKCSECIDFDCNNCKIFKNY